MKARKEWSEEQKQVARERMAHARAARSSNTAVQKRHQTPEKRLDGANTPDLVLTIRRIKIGSFMGLWELGKVLPDGGIQIISDANTKQLIINLARNEILKCGLD